MDNYSSWATPTSTTERIRCIPHLFVLFCFLFGLVGTTTAWADDDDRIDIDRASWSNYRDRLSVSGDKAPDRTTVTIRYGNRGDNGAVIGTTQSDGDGDWEFRISGNDLGTVPCDVTAQAAGVDDDDREVSRAPNNCSNDGGGGNTPPEVTNPGTQTNTEGDTVSLQIVATDADTLSYSATGLPADLGINSSTGLISGTIAAGTAASYSVTVSVTDGVNSPVTVTFDWNVNPGGGGNNPPNVTNPGDQTNNEGNLVSLQIVATDDPGDTLNYSATGLPLDLSIDPNSGQITGTIAADAAASSPYSVTVSVTDDGSPPATTSVTFQWVVNVGGVNNPPTAVDQTFPIDTAVLDRAGPDGILGNAEVAVPGVLLNAADPDNDTLIAVLVGDVIAGTLDLSPDGSFSYTPNAGTTADSFTYLANDGEFDSGVQTVDLTVQTGLQVNTTSQNKFNIMMNYELGMHCTGFEFAYCCVLPPYNSIIAQVARSDKGNNDSDFPMLLEGDPNNGLDALGRETVLREPQLDGNGNFNKYVLRYWHEAQPRNDGRGKPQSSTLISAAEGNSLFMWNTVYDAADTDEGNNLVTGTYEGATGVVKGDSDYNDANDNYASGWMNHFYIYADLEGSNPANSTAEKDKIRLGLENLNASTPLSLVMPTDCGPAFHPLGPDTQNGDPNNPVVDNTCGGFSKGNLLTFSGDAGTVVFTQMKVLENLPVMLTSPDIWEALGLPLTPFEDSIDFFGDPGLVDEDSIRPYVAMKAQLHNYNPGAPGGVGGAVMDNGHPVIGFGTAPIDIPNCERCHSELQVTSQNSAQQIGGRNAVVAADVQLEIDYWMDIYGLVEGVDSTWYPRLKGAAISILAIHDQQHGTSFTSEWPATYKDPFPLNIPDGNISADKLAFPQNTRLGKESVICQKCHADNVIAVVKSADCAPGNLMCSSPGALIPPITEAIHDNHRNVSDGGEIVFADSNGRDGGCQGCHPAHRSDGDMAGYPITIEGDNLYDGNHEGFPGDNRDANGGCFVGRDVHSNPGKDSDGAGTPEHLNAVGQYLADNVFSNQGASGDKGIWCTNCHTQLSQEIWRNENMVDLVHNEAICSAGPNLGEPCNVDTDCGTDGFCGNIRGRASLADVAAALDPPVTEEQAIAWLDPTADNPLGDFTHEIWNPDVSDASVATVETNAVGNCKEAPYTNWDPGTTACVAVDGDGNPSVRIMEDFCTTPDCVAVAQATLDNEGNGSDAVAVPFSVADDGRDHWLSAGEPHCADCHEAPYTEQSGNINAFPPFNYPRKASLMRYSRGHQDISCQGCHESIHGLYPVTPTIDTTSYAQAANLNADGSHGPIKCGSCHQDDADGIPTWIDSGLGISNFDEAVTWAHTYTDEASVLNSTCQNCHGVNGEDRRNLNSTPADWDEVSDDHGSYLEHAMDDEDKDLPRGMMDKAEIEVSGAVFSSTDGSDGVCRGCHGDESDEVSCGDTEWKQHLTEGRVAQSTWEHVTDMLLGDGNPDTPPETCGW